MADVELNYLPYDKALKNDKRTFCQYYISLVKTKHIIIFTLFNLKKLREDKLDEALEYEVQYTLDFLERYPQFKPMIKGVKEV